MTTPLIQSTAAWYNSLPMSVQQKLATRLESIYRSLPQTLQSKYQRDVISQVGVAPFSPALDGINGGGGLGWLETLATTLISGGISLGGQTINSVLSGRLQKDLQANAIASNEQIAAAQAAASKQAQDAINAAQADAIRVAAQATVIKAQIDADSAQQTSLINSIPGGGLTLLAVGGVAVAGILYVVLRKGRK
jgi:hypothetical protein